MNKKEKQILRAYRNSYDLMQAGKRHDDEVKKDSKCKKHFITFDYYNGKPVCPMCSNPLIF